MGHRGDYPNSLLGRDSGTDVNGKISPCSSYAKFYRRSHNAVIRVYDEGSNVIETHEHARDLKEW